MKFKYIGKTDGMFYSLGYVEPDKIYETNDKHLINLIQKSSDFVKEATTKKPKKRKGE